MERDGEREREAEKEREKRERERERQRKKEKLSDNCYDSPSCLFFSYLLESIG
jgi:hypothetical protein